MPTAGHQVFIKSLNLIVTRARMHASVWSARYHCFDLLTDLQHDRHLQGWMELGQTRRVWQKEVKCSHIPGKQAARKSLLEQLPRWAAALHPICGAAMTFSMHHFLVMLNTTFGPGSPMAAEQAAHSHAGHVHMISLTNDDTHGLLQQFCRLALLNYR